MKRALSTILPRRGGGGGATVLMCNSTRCFSGDSNRSPTSPPVAAAPIDPRDFQPLAYFLNLPDETALVPGRTLDLSRGQLVDILGSKDDALEKSLYAFADASTRAYFGNVVFPRGIVEFSNVCTKDCFYCGIRKHMKVHRYTMTKEEILTCADFAFEQGMGTVMLQSGELPTPERIEFMLDVVRTIRQRSVELDLKKHGVGRKGDSSSSRGSDTSTDRSSSGDNDEAEKKGAAEEAEVMQPQDSPSHAERGLAVALSLGELPSEIYQAFYDAGARRYLLRIESSNPELYGKLHPRSHSYDRRVACLKELKRIGFQVGTGVMVGVPYQTYDDMAGDLLFFKDFGADMIGLGPYVVQSETPLGKIWLAERAHFTPDDFQKENAQVFNLTTRMYALARLILGDVNIAATTALQVINPIGREIALHRGANVVMPIITPKRLRKNYQIYQNKPGVDEDSLTSTACLDLRVQSAGKELLLDGGWHDPPHSQSKTKRQQN